jgi:hypothetical protein
MKRHRFSEEEKQDIQKRYSRGETQKQIAEVYSTYQPVVSKVLKTLEKQPAEEKPDRERLVVLLRENIRFCERTVQILEEILEKTQASERII